MLCCSLASCAGLSRSPCGASLHCCCCCGSVVGPRHAAQQKTTSGLALPLVQAAAQQSKQRRHRQLQGRGCAEGASQGLAHEAAQGQAWLALPVQAVSTSCFNVEVHGVPLCQLKQRHQGAHMLRCTSTAATRRRVSCTAHLLQRLLQALQQHNCIVCVTHRVMLQLLAEQLSLLSSERCWCCCCCCCHDPPSDSQVEISCLTCKYV